MKQLRNALPVVLLLLSLSAGFAQGPAAKPADPSKAAKNVKVKYDKGKDLTTVTLKSIALSSALTKEVNNLGEAPQLDLTVSFTHPGQQVAKRVDSLFMKFKVTSKYPVFQRGQNLMAVVNNDRAIPIGDTKYTSTSQTFYMEEFLTGEVAYEIMQRISDAQSVSLFLGSREIKLKPEHLDDLREMTKRMAP